MIAPTLGPGTSPFRRTLLTRPAGGGGGTASSAHARLQLAKAARDTDADVIVFCGVHFMAETAKILNPDRVVLIPDMKAGCSLADAAPAKRVAKWKADHPGSVLVSYVNCSAGVKAVSDIICTSSNAVRVIESIPEDQQILFCPDKNLGR